MCRAGPGRRAALLEQEFPGECEGEWWVGGDDAADGCGVDDAGVGGDDVGGQGRAEAKGECEPGQRPGGLAGAAVYEHGHGGGEYEPVDGDG
jgi:hypothetical protein